MTNPKHEALAAIEGLTFADCSTFFDAKATDREKAIADMCDAGDEEFEVDGAITSEGDDNGAYVMGWRWVSFEGTPLDKNTEDEEEEA
jgi:hypothetical protein